MIYNKILAIPMCYSDIIKLESDENSNVYVYDKYTIINTDNYNIIIEDYHRKYTLTGKELLLYKYNNEIYIYKNLNNRDLWLRKEWLDITSYNPPEYKVYYDNKFIIRTNDVEQICINVWGKNIINLKVLKNDEEIPTPYPSEIEKFKTYIRNYSRYQIFIPDELFQI